jgi:glutathione S-transferase
MAIEMYDLAGADASLRFSPYCWRTRLALAHKGLAVQTIPWRFTETDALAFSGQGRVPVIRDGDRVMADSWSIAEYLEDTYPDRPSLFGGATGRAHARFINAWADSVVLGAIARLIVRDVLDVVDPKDRGYFRESREARFGMTLEAVQEGRDVRVAESCITDAGAAGAGQAALARWGVADVRGLHPVRYAAMAALRQPVRGVGGGRSDGRVARADA